MVGGERNVWVGAQCGGGEGGGGGGGGGSVAVLGGVGVWVVSAVFGWGRSRGGSGAVAGWRRWLFAGGSKGTVRRGCGCVGQTGLFMCWSRGRHVGGGGRHVGAGGAGGRAGQQ